MSYLLVGLGGAFGAMGRFGVGQLIMRMGLTGWPYATLAVNIVGSFAMGLVIALLARHTPDWSHSARLWRQVFAAGSQPFQPSRWILSAFMSGGRPCLHCFMWACQLFCLLRHCSRQWHWCAGVQYEWCSTSKNNAGRGWYAAGPQVLHSFS